MMYFALFLGTNLWDKNILAGVPFAPLNPNPDEVDRKWR